MSNEPDATWLLGNYWAWMVYAGFVYGPRLEDGSFTRAEHLARKD